MKVACAEEGSAKWKVLRVTALPADFPELVRESLSDGHRMLARMQAEWESGENRFDLSGEALFVSQRAGKLVAVCGLNRDPYSKRGRCGRLRRLYVSVAHRRRGIATEVTDAALREARGGFERVRLRTFNPEAAVFYLARGFRAVTDEMATHEFVL